MTGARRAALVAWTCVVLPLAGCGSEPRPPGVSEGAEPSAGPPLVAVSLPGELEADASLRERLRAGSASLAALQGASPPASRADLASAYGEVGKLLLAAELLQHAEPYLLNARALAPGELAWPYYLASLYRLANDRERAVQYYEEALRLRPGFVPALVWLGAVHLDGGDPLRAGPLLRQAVSIEPRSAAAHFGLGRAAIASGDYARARDHLEAALEADPRATRAHYPLALAYRALGDSARADAHLREWRQEFSPAESLRDPQIPPADPLMEEIGTILGTAVAYETRGLDAMDARQWTQAAALFREGLKIAPRDPALHQNLGTALFLAGDAAGAAAAFETAVRLSPGYARAHFSLGVLAESNARDEEALERYAAAVRHDATFADARFRLAEGLRRAGRFEASLAQYEHLVRADPAASQARFGLAMALVRIGRYREARAALEEAVRLHPDQPGFPHALARVLAAAPEEGVRDGARALRLIEELRQTYGATPALLESLAMALAETGRFSEAAARQRDAISAAAGQGRHDLAGALRDNLARYETGTPCRLPWPPDDPVHVPPRVSGLGL